MGKKVIDVADKPTLDNILSLSEHALDMLESPEKKPIRYGIKIAKNDYNPMGRITYTFDAKGMTPAHLISTETITTSMSDAGYAHAPLNYGDWESAWFVREAIPVFLSYDGDEIELDPRDYSIEKVSRKTVNISSTSLNGNIMVKLPLVYVSLNEDNLYQYITISNVKWDDTYVPIGHIKADGTVAEYSYLGIYKAYYLNNKLRSLSGQNPTTNVDFLINDDYYTANGSNWCAQTWGQRFLIYCLVTIMGKSDNSQEVFGTSHDNITATGRGNKLGKFAGRVYDATGGNVKIFCMEDFYGGGYEYTDGLFLDITGGKYTFYTSWGGGGIRTKSDLNNLQNYPDYVKTDLPPYVHGNSLSSAHKGTSVTTYGGYGVDSYIAQNVGRIPISVGGSSTTYLCDGVTIVGSGVGVDGLYRAFLGGGNSTTYRGVWSYKFDDCTNKHTGINQNDRVARIAYMK